MNAILNLDTYKDICNAVREKKNETDLYLASDLPSKIRSIEGGAADNDEVELKYPDLLKDLNTESNSIYCLLHLEGDYNMFVCRVYYSGSVKTTAEVGHIEGNNFVRDATVATTYTSGTYILVRLDNYNINGEYAVVKLTQPNLTYYSFMGTTLIPNLNGTGTFGVVPAIFNVISIVADVPTFNCTTNNVSCITYNTEIFRIKNVSDKCTALYCICNGGRSLKKFEYINCNFNNVVYLNYAFLNCTSLESIDLSGFYQNTRTVNVDFYYAFYGCSKSKYITLPDAKGRFVSSLYYTFRDCRRLERIYNIETYDAGKANTNSAFLNCYSLKELSINQTNFENVSANVWFDFTLCYLLEEVNINVDTSISGNGINCSSDSIRKITVYNLPTSSTVNVSGSNIERSSLLHLLDKLPNITTTKTFNLGINKNKLTSDEIKIATDKGWTVA